MKRNPIAHTKRLLRTVLFAGRPPPPPPGCMRPRRRHDAHGVTPAPPPSAAVNATHRTTAPAPSPYPRFQFHAAVLADTPPPTHHRRHAPPPAQTHLRHPSGAGHPPTCPPQLPTPRQCSPVCSSRTAYCIHSIRDLSPPSLNPSPPGRAWREEGEQRPQVAALEAAVTGGGGGGSDSASSKLGLFSLWKDRTGIDMSDQMRGTEEPGKRVGAGRLLIEPWRCGADNGGACCEIRAARQNLPREPRCEGLPERWPSLRSLRQRWRHQGRPCPLVP